MLKDDLAITLKEIKEKLNPPTSVEEETPQTHNVVFDTLRTLEQQFNTVFADLVERGLSIEGTNDSLVLSVRDSAFKAEWQISIFNECNKFVIADQTTLLSAVTADALPDAVIQLVKKSVGLRNVLENAQAVYQSSNIQQTNYKLIVDALEENRKIDSKKEKQNPPVPTEIGAFLVETKALLMSVLRFAPEHIRILVDEVSISIVNHKIREMWGIRISTTPYGVFACSPSDGHYLRYAMNTDELFKIIAEEMAQSLILNKVLES